MLIVLGDVYAQIQRRDRARELMIATQASAREDPDCISYDFAETLEDPGHFLITQRWRDPAALERHYRSPAFGEYRAHIGESLVRSSELNVYVVGEAYVPFDTGPIEPQQED